MKNIAPCYICTQRIPPTSDHDGCHSFCSRYLEYESKKLEKDRQRRTEWLHSDDLRNYDFLHIRKRKVVKMR